MEIFNKMRKAIFEDENIFKELESIGIIVEAHEPRSDSQYDHYFLGATYKKLPKSLKKSPWLFSSNNLPDFIKQAKLFLSGVNYIKRSISSKDLKEAEEYWKNKYCKPFDSSYRPY